MVERFGGKVQMATSGYRLRGIQQRGEQRVERTILRAANIQRQRHLAGNDVNRTRGAAQRPHRSHQVSPVLPGCRLNEDHPFGGGGQRIPTLTHRNRSGMARFAGKTAVQAAGTVDRLHHPERQSRLLKARPLLNVQLQITSGYPPSDARPD
ncbi:Uncharacterised protein [Raoultella ornithinolytica]|nr:Uncharacterised protein [Raoultella ornithinolytica]